ncbi:MAG: hypothetical protein ACREMJ_09950 [Gemmatimonadales bacterium]
MRCPFVCTLIVTLAAASLAAQSDTTGTDSTRADSARADSMADSTPAPAPAPTPPTPEQQRYLDGLKRVGRGIAQLNTAVDQATRAAAGADSVAQRRAYRRLGGYCTSARSFMTGGRARMQATAYEDTTRLRAAQLARQVDEIIRYTRSCEDEAAGAPTRVAAEMQKRLQTYEQALAEFRTATGAPSAP